MREFSGFCHPTVALCVFVRNQMWISTAKTWKEMTEKWCEMS